MKILVTGAKGFVGKNLCAELRNIKDGKSRCWGDLVVDEVFEYDVDSTSEELDEWCKECDFGGSQSSAKSKRVYGREFRFCFHVA